MSKRGCTHLVSLDAVLEQPLPHHPNQEREKKKERKKKEGAKEREEGKNKPQREDLREGVLNSCTMPTDPGNIHTQIPAAALEQ